MTVVFVIAVIHTSTICQKKQTTPGDKETKTQKCLLGGITQCVYLHLCVFSGDNTSRHICIAATFEGKATWV